MFIFFSILTAKFWCKIEFDVQGAGWEIGQNSLFPPHWTICHTLSNEWANKISAVAAIRHWVGVRAIWNSSICVYSLAVDVGGELLSAENSSLCVQRAMNSHEWCHFFFLAGNDARCVHAASKTSNNVHQLQSKHVGCNQKSANPPFDRQAEFGSYFEPIHSLADASLMIII